MDSLLPFIFLSIISLGFALWGIHLKKQNSLVNCQLKSLEGELTSTKGQFTDLEQQIHDLSSFENNVNEAHITTKLQTSRLGTNTYKAVNGPEKYQYICSLTEKGLGATEIASILSLSEYEAKQLVSLAQISSQSKSTT